MAIDGLMEKLERAAGVAARATKKIEERADALLAREGNIAKRTDEVFAPHEQVLKTAEQGLDKAEAALALLSNDPLAHSGGGLTGGQVADPLSAGGKQ